MTSDRRLLAGAFALAVIVAACGGSGAATPAATDNGNGGNATPAATDNGGNNPTLEPGNATALEAMIPDKIGSTTFQKTSFDYGSIPWASLSGALGSGGLDTVLKDNGKTLADVAFAMAFGTGTGGLPSTVYAFQVKGLDASKFVTGIDSSYATETDMTVGGKAVKGSIDSGYGQVTYVHNDVVFMCMGSEADLNALVAALP